MPVATATNHQKGKPHGRGKLIGLTMALIGVLIAFCAALVGSERNEPTRTMIEQTQAHSDYSSASTKFRLIMLDLEKQRGVVPVPAPISEGQIVPCFAGCCGFTRITPRNVNFRRTGPTATVR